MTTACDEALSAESIRALLGVQTAAALAEVTVLPEVDSTNAVLARLPARRAHRHAVLAETQTRGRGRRQRSWYSPAGGNIYLSLGWRFPAAAAPLSTLPLAVAVCVAVALERAGLSGHGIKWPNDILVNGAKLAGILVETQSEGQAAVCAVIGIGLNVRMPALAGSEPIDRPWTDLARHLPPERRDIGRNMLAATLLDELLSGLARFESDAFEPFRKDWNRLDLVTGRRVRLEANGGFHTGTALGIADNGGLTVDIDGYGQQVLHAAEVSIYDE